MGAGASAPGSVNFLSAGDVICVCLGRGHFPVRCGDIGIFVVLFVGFWIVLSKNGEPIAPENCLFMLEGLFMTRLFITLWNIC